MKIINLNQIFNMKINRRKFIYKSFIGMIISSILPERLFSKNLNECEQTTSDIQGPFFLENIPFNNPMIPEDYSGSKLYLSGKLKNLNCKSPISNGILDFWQADQNGNYDEAGYSFRTKILTNNDGSYILETILPGKYLNGSQYRPSHIHLKVQAENYDELTTQIYFDGDEDIQSDPWASNLNSINRIISLNNINGDYYGEFDIVLNQNLNINENHKTQFGDISQNFPNPFSIETKLIIVLNNDSSNLVEIYDSKGSKVDQLLNDYLPKGRYELNWNSTKFNKGIYNLVWSCENKIIKQIKLIKN